MTTQPDMTKDEGLLSAAIKAVAKIEMDREGYPLSRTQEEIYEDAAEMVQAVLALLPTPSSADNALRDALEKCRDQFQFYANEHRNAGKHEKAATNQRYADLCASALTCSPAAEAEPVEVCLIETVTGDFMQEPGEPFWRIEIDGYCADFDHEQAASNFASAINRRLYATPVSPTPVEAGALHPDRDVIAYSIIEGSAGIRAAEHAKDFQTANWTDALRSADAVIGSLAALPQPGSSESGDMTFASASSKWSGMPCPACNGAGREDDYFGFPCTQCASASSQLSSGALQFVTDDAARRFQAKHRELWPGAGWPNLNDAKELMISALTPSNKERQP